MKKLGYKEDKKKGERLTRNNKRRMAGKLDERGRTQGMR